MKKLIIYCLLLITNICQGQYQPAPHRIVIEALPHDGAIFDTTDAGVRIDSQIDESDFDILVTKEIHIDSIQKQTANGFSKLDVIDSNSVTLIYRTRLELTADTMSLRLWQNGHSIAVVLGHITPHVIAPGGQSQGAAPQSADCMCDEIFNYEDQLVHYDFKCKVFYKLVGCKESGYKKQIINIGSYHFRNRDQFRLKIDRVNRYLYDVDIIGKNITYESTVPPLLSTFFIGDTTLLKVISNRATAQSKNMENKDLSDEIRKFNEKLQSVKRHIAELEDSQMNAYDICYEGPCCANRPKIPAYSSIVNDINAVKGMLPILKKKIADDEIIQQNNLKDVTSQLATHAANQAEIDGIGKKLLSKPKDAKALRARKQVLEAQNKKIDLNELRSRQAYIQSTLEIYEAVKSFSPAFPTEKEVKRLVMFVKDIVKDNFMFVTPPMQVTGNKFELGIQIRPKDTSLFPDNTPYYSDYSYYEFPVFGKAFVSFSSGSFVTFARDFYNRTYDWQKVPNNLNMVADSGKYRLVETGYTPLPIGFSALANVEWKLKESWGLGFSAGVGLTMEKNPRLAYLGGGSMFFGDLHQFALTAGLAGMNVDRLANNLQAVHDQQIVYTFKDRVDYYKEFRIGGFMAITYTPFNAVKRPVYRSINKSVRNAKAQAYDAENRAAAAKAKADAAKIKEDEAKKANEDAVKNIETTKKALADATTKAADTKKAFDAAAKKTTDLKKAYEDAASKAASSQKPEDITKAEEAKKAYEEAKKAEDDAKKALDDATKKADDAKSAADDAVTKADKANKSYEEAHQKAEELKKAADEVQKIAVQMRQAADNAEKMAGAANK